MHGNIVLYSTLRDALSLAHHLYRQFKFGEAKSAIQEAYEIVIMASNPTHHLAYKAANQLISVLIQLKEYYDAERFVDLLRVCVAACGS